MSIKLSRAAAICAAIALAGLSGACARIRDHKGYVVDSTLIGTVQPGVDNRESVSKTLGRPSFAGQFDGDKTWYYVARDTRQIAFRTNVDDVVQAGPDHPMRFDMEAGGGVKPYIRIRGDLWALVTRALAHDLVAMGEERSVDGGQLFGIAAGGAFYSISTMSGLDLA